MRSAALCLALVAGAACTTRTQPYRFGSPMLGRADVPLAALPKPRPDQPTRDQPSPAPLVHRTAEQIRVVSAPRVREASAEAANAIVALPNAQRAAWLALPAPHRTPDEALGPVIREPADLRRWVGRRDSRDPFVAAMAWARQLGGGGIAIEASSAAAAVEMAKRSQRAGSATAVALPGDVLVFDRVISDDRADFAAIVTAHDPRGVTEFVYLGGGVIRRGFVDATRPTMRRDADGRIVNTYLRTGKRLPPRGTRYLAGELLAHVVHAR